jgi:hypothetical protein
MAENSGSGKAIYGQIPDGGAGKVASEAMKDLGESSSNKVNGPLSSKDSDYPEKG